MLFAQSPELTAIREQYAKITKASKEAPDKANEGGIYCNRITENVHSASWRAVGLYKKTFEFWYDDEPGMACEDLGGNEACHLQFITEDAQTGYGAWHSEYLYQDGVLVFAFLAHEGGEYRYYWKNNGDMFRFQHDKEIMDPDTPQYIIDAKEIWDEGQKFRQKYIDLF